MFYIKNTKYIILKRYIETQGDSKRLTQVYIYELSHFSASEPFLINKEMVH